MFQIILFGLQLFLAHTKIISIRDIFLAIDCGSRVSSNSHYGVVFQSDQYYSASFTKDMSVDMNQKIIEFSDSSIYLTYRYNDGDFNYLIDLSLKAKDKFVLILLFAELEYTSPRERIFHVDIGNTRVIKGLDIYAESGNILHLEYIPLEYDGKNILYKGKPCINALYESNITKFDILIDRYLKINFIQTEYGDPMINGFLAVRGMLNSTDYDEYQELKKILSQIQVQNVNYSIKKEDIQKRKQIVKIREGYEYEVEDASNKNLESSMVQMEWHLIKKLILSPVGVFGFVVLIIMAFILISFAFFDPYGYVINNL